jgi:hypothetical protein
VVGVDLDDLPDRIHAIEYIPTAAARTRRCAIICAQPLTRGFEAELAPMTN